MKTRIKILLAMPALFIALQSSAVNVTIIESLSGNSWAVQDVVWQNVALGMGYSANVVPQTTLDDIANLINTDVLVVASGTISFTGTNHLQTIRQFVLSGRPVYIQSEYLGTYQGTITFDSLMQAVNANFNWIGTISGQLTPMNVLGTLATTPNNIPTLNYFNYGYAGTGSGVEKFLQYQGNYFGFCYSDSVTSNGTVITVSDEDWAWQNASPDLMENILYRLANSTTSINSMEANNASINIFPNPFSNELNIMNANSDSEAVIYDLNGKEIMRNHISEINAKINTSHLAPGFYFINYREENKTVNEKVVKF